MAMHKMVVLGSVTMKKKNEANEEIICKKKESSDLKMRRKK